MSEFLIGVTIVAVGTSMPEFVVSVQSAMAGQADVSIGNVVGSNIFNIYAILGLTALVAPLSLSAGSQRRDIPLCLTVSLLLCLLALDGFLWGGEANVLSRGDGVILLLLYVVFLWYAIRSGRRATTTVSPAPKPQTTTAAKQTTIWLAVVMVGAGFCGLIFGSDLFLGGAIELARKIGLSEAVIGIVFVAAGTSMPELFASIVPALKGKSEIALGNILGSNIANILFILGTSATITPLRLGGITPLDLGVMVSAVVMVLLSSHFIGHRKIMRVEGAIFLAIYVGYTLWLLR